MRPLRSFLLLLIFIVSFSGLHYIVPAKRLFPSVNEFVPANLTKELFRGDDASEDKAVEIQPEVPEIASPDTVITSIPDSSAVRTLPVNPLTRFLDSLKYSRGQVRVIYYGDSQIEGDRITSYLRQSLRHGHGGTGPGLFLPLMPVMYTKTIWLRSSSNWKKYNYLSFRSGEISHRDLGPFMAICRYLPEGEKTMVPEKAYIRIRPSNIADSSSSEYDELRIFYGKVSDTVNLRIRADRKEVFACTLQRGNGYYETGCGLHRAKEITIEFEGVVSPDIYGISIESKAGVIVDNIPQRGSAGLEFTMVGRNNLSEAYGKLKPDLVILHYGLNIVKNVREEYSYFQKGLERQLALIKAISPYTPILVISLTDMAERKGDSIRSYRNIPAIINAQKQATSKAGEAFWDSYQSMG